MSAPAYHAVLTGASGGLGQAMARTLAAQCSAMVLVGRDRPKLQTLERELRVRQPALSVELVAGDLTDGLTRQRVFDAARAFRAPPDLLVNNAGINEFHEFESQQGAAIERLLAVNLLAPIQLTQKLLPLLKSASRAQIINVGSIFGYLGYPGFAVYGATKFGLRGFSQSLRRELADTFVAVRYFAPRTTRTPLTTPTISAMNKELNTREDTPEAVARLLVEFIATNAWDRKLGFPERMYVFLNHLLPIIGDSAIRRQLKTIKKFLPARAGHSNQPQKEWP